MSKDQQPQQAVPDAPEAAYEPPRAEALAGPDRAATAAWTKTGFQPPEE